eukprot:TRINITY_DN104536_c0_g1_i1.p1 TRINITY_DN104536_c0_g1~~TRINITY_DN104536_c0_g1_i1.p1  ORF type:complete len:216 (-),score=22.49 TRINITY_DN104536_c0_g1_i1:43-663(-)
MAAAVAAAQPWVTCPVQPPTFSVDTNQGLSRSVSQLLSSNNFKARTCYEEAKAVRSTIRNDPEEIWAIRTAPRPRSAGNTGLNTSLKPDRPASAPFLRGSSGLPEKHKPVPIDPQTGRPIGPDPRQKHFFRTRSSLTMGYVDGVASNPSGKAREVFMTHRYGAYVAHASEGLGRDRAVATRIFSTGDLSVGSKARAASTPVGRRPR